MARLPDPIEILDDDEVDAFERMAQVRAGAEGKAELAEVYVRMFNNPSLAIKVGELGELLRFNGILPDFERELAILRFAARVGSAYEWAHHQRPAIQAGVDRAMIDAIAAGDIPATLPDTARAVLEAVDAVVAKRSIPKAVQQRLFEAFGNAGVVEVVALCGLYGLMDYMVTAFDIEVEPWLPDAPSPCP